MEKLKTVIEDHGLRGVKYGPIYNGVPLDDPRMDPLYHYCIPVSYTHLRAHET